MDLLTIDVLGYLINFIKKDLDKCYFLMTCKRVSQCEFYFNEQKNIDKITNLLWFDHFTNIVCDNNKIKLPLFVRYLKFGMSFNESIKNFISSSVKYLLFDVFFNQPIKDCIPSSVIYLSLIGDFDHPIKDCIPSSVIYLEFGNKFNQPIKDCIPSSVIYLGFDGKKFNQSIKDCIPSSVIHLSFGVGFKQPIKNYIPSSVTHLVLNSEYHTNIIDNIPTTVTHLTYGYLSISDYDDFSKGIMEKLLNTNFNNGPPRLETGQDFGDVYKQVYNDKIPSHIKQLRINGNIIIKR